MDPEDGEKDRGRHAVNFWCGLEGSQVERLEKDPGGRFVFTGNMSSMGNMTLMSVGDGQWNVKTSLKKCNFNGDGKTVTCDLRLKGMER
ncbi:hypothetical protein DNK47_01820 [Mycoplasma wenyonii]|uniref:Uncharacterized protein n=1 Tax=Mycoplasma wenyonii TaxID=65123 RepID=A0A328PUA6_9MOLU|nr:hypothetical protein [Mycoplasma wenyonii]RAO95001.1 hypothetical protein DNK47_01820 [Mycoplasma wenyonii]